MSDNVIRVDKPTPCFVPENRDIFEQIIDITVDRQDGKQDSKRLRAAVNVAHQICMGCPEREQCLTVHGRDYRLGMVAGATDAQREEFFEGKTA